MKTRNPIISSIKVPSADVKGINTERAQKITHEITSDIGDGVDGAKKQVLDTKVSDIISIVSRVQKIPQDVHNIQEYVMDQVGSVLKLGK